MPEKYRPRFCMFEAKPQKMPQKRKKRLENMVFSSLIGGELGIRTLGGLPHTAFRVLHLRPLGQLSILHFTCDNYLYHERGGFASAFRTEFVHNPPDL